MAFDIDAASSANSGTPPASSLTWSHTNAGNLLLVGVSMRELNTADITSVTYNGDALTLVDGIDGQWSTMAVFRLLSPDVGTFNIVITLPSSIRFSAAALSFLDADGTTPLGTPVKTSGSSDSSSINVSSASGEIVADFLGVRGNDALVEGAGQTSQAENVTTHSTSVANAAVGLSTKPGATSVAMSWSWATAIDFSHVGVSVKPAAGGGGGTAASGLAAGASSATGSARALFLASGAAAGSAVVSGVGRAAFRASGLAAGSSTVTGVPAVAGGVFASGLAEGATAVTGVGKARAFASGLAAGQATVIGHAPSVPSEGGDFLDDILTINRLTTVMR